MGMTIEIFATETQELVSLLTHLCILQYDEKDSSAFDTLYDVLQHYPKAEFPTRLLIPDDLDSMCAILHRYHPGIESRFQDITEKEVWNDGQGTETLTLLTEQFARAVATLSEHELQQAALEWTATYPIDEPATQSLPYQAMIQLRDVARRAVSERLPLLFHLEGCPGFFEYLRYL